MINNLEELLLELDKEPDEVKENEDKSKYVAISTVQSTLDKLFGYYSWNFEKETFGRSQAIGKGLLIVTFPNGAVITKSGTAGIELNNIMKLDYPRLETMCMLNAAKKLGRRFGRELNRMSDDAPLPVTQLREKTNEDDEFAAKDKIKAALIVAETREDCENIIGQSGMEWIFKNDMQVKEILKNKPSKKTA